MQIFAKPISKLCNLSMALESFPGACKFAKAKPLFKEGSKWIHQITDQYLCYFCYLKSLKDFFLIRQNTSSASARFYMTINPILKIPLNRYRTLFFERQNVRRFW